MWSRKLIYISNFEFLKNKFKKVVIEVKKKNRRPSASYATKKNLIEVYDLTYNSVTRFKIPFFEYLFLLLQLNLYMING